METEEKKRPPSVHFQCLFIFVAFDRSGAGVKRQPPFKEKQKTEFQTSMEKVHTETNRERESARAL